MIGKGIFHTHLVVRDIEKSLRFYIGLFGMQRVGFKDGTLVFLTTPGRDDLLALNPGGEWGYPGGCAKEQPREEKLAGVQGGMAHFGYMLLNKEEYERAIASVEDFGGKLVVRCDHGGITTHTYLKDPDGYVVEIQYGR
jgi:catechol 2,3-dioxygenase-like lactoylglutathione lyase family enzyme